jgi:hypothetical protein
MVWEGDTVVLEKSVPGIPVPIGAQGIVIGVFAFSKPTAYDVDSFDENHAALGLFRVFGDENFSLKISIRDQLEGLK